MKRLAEEGAKVTLCSRKQPNVDKALRKIEEFGLADSIIGMKCHVSDTNEREQLLAKVIRSHIHHRAL